MHGRTCRPTAANSRKIGAGRPEKCGKMTGSMKIAIIALYLSSVEVRCGVSKPRQPLPVNGRWTGGASENFNICAATGQPIATTLRRRLRRFRDCQSNPASRQSDFPPTAEESTDRPPAIVPVMAAMQSEPGLVAPYLRTHQPILFSIAGKWRAARFSVSEKGRVCQSNRHGLLPGQD